MNRQYHVGQRIRLLDDNRIATEFRGLPGTITLTSGFMVELILDYDPSQSSIGVIRTISNEYIEPHEYVT